MKTFARRTLLVIAAVTGFALQTAQAQVAVDVTIGGFYDELAPYGRWVDCSYGQCWVPARVAADWQPYSNGQWIYTDYGWTWVSDDPWGGSPYHYGTWTSIEGYGWSWVPGTVWAPAWVTWNYSNDYVGWAPLPPTVVFGASGYSGRPVVVTRTQYVFVPTNRFVGRNVATVRLPPARSAEIFAQTTAVTGFAVSGGIIRNTALPMATIERAGGKIETRSIETARTAPRAMPAGAARLSVVAPAREVKAAAAAHPQTASRAPESSRDEKHAAQAPASSRDEKHKAQAAQAPAREAKAPAAGRPQPVSSSSDSSQANKHAKASAEPQAQSEKAKKGPQAPPMDSHRPEAQAPAEPRQEPPPRTEASAHAPKPKSQPAKAKEKAKEKKPEEKDKKPDGGNP